MSFSSPPPIYPPRIAYNLAAIEYDNWVWQKIWRKTEMPVVLSWVCNSGHPRLLDLGCGTGVYLKRFLEMGVHCVGLDLSVEMLRIAMRRLNRCDCLVLGDVRKLPFRSVTFDQILLTRVLSHIDNPAAVFSEARRVLQKSGSIIISDIHPEHNYSNTELPVFGTKISVETYKRSLIDLARTAALEGGFGLLRYTLIKPCDILPWMKSGQATSINANSDHPISFIAEFTIKD